MDSKSISFTVNGQPKTLSTHPDRPLLDVLREDLRLTGAHYGCGEGQCGACSVLINGKRVFSCINAASEADGKTIQTVEGLANGESLHPVQRAFLEEGAFQCGYCTSGMIVAAVSLLNATPHPTDAEVRTGMNGNLCRCCSYAKIAGAVRRAAGAVADGK